MRRAAVLLALAIAGTSAVPARADDLRAGAASADITAPVGTPMFAYTARSRTMQPDAIRDLATQLLADPERNFYAKSFVPSRGFHTRVRARALVLERDGRKLALVQTDLGGLPYALVQDVARRIAASGITADRMLLSATHTHASTGPIWPPDSLGYGVLGGDLFDPRTFGLTARGIAEAVLRADARLRPARLGVGRAWVGDAARSRAFEPFRRDHDVPRDEAAAKAASIDPELNVIRVDTARGRPMAVWSNYAIHGTSFDDDNALFSGDNPGYAERIAEGEIARLASREGRYVRAGDVVNVFTNGNEGDISPQGDPARLGKLPLQYVDNDFASAHMAGLRVARGIVRAWRRAGSRTTRTPDLRAGRVMLRFDGTPANGEPVGPLAVLGFGGITGPDGFCAPFDGFAGPGQGRKFPEFSFPALPSGPGAVPGSASVSVVRVGPLGLLGFPTEVTRQMGARIEGAALAASGGAVDRFVGVDLTNGYLSYTATPEEYDGCQYEGSFTLFGRQQGPRYLGVARALAAAVLAGGPFPASAPEPAPLGFQFSELPTRRTPAAGAIVREPQPVVGRLGRAVFSWRGGDPSVDAPRGRAFVTLEHRDRTGRWRAAATDDSFTDTTHRAPRDVWTETWQFDRCDTTGLYRFHVRGRADRGAGVRGYEVVSRPFEVRPLSNLSLGPVTVAGGAALVRVGYPDPGKETLLAVPRYARSGRVTLEVRDGGSVERVRARPRRGGIDYVAAVPDGSSVHAVSARDRCGNEGAR